MIKNGDTVRIISDGSGSGTKVVDADGKMIPNVFKASWECEAAGRSNVTLWVITGQYLLDREKVQCFGSTDAKGEADIVLDYCGTV